MAIRVVARIRPRQQKELDKDVIISTASNSDDSPYPTEVKIPNPRNERETFTFQFNSIYDHLTTQQQLFDSEGNSKRKIGGLIPIDNSISRTNYQAPLWRI